MIRKIISAFFALALTGGILLVSDLQNRHTPPKKKSSPVPGAGNRALPGRSYKIGVSAFGPDASFDQTLEGLWEGLAELGFVRDSNLKAVIQHANGEIANLVPLHQNLDNMDLDLIVVTSTPGVMAALSAVKKHPVVFTMTFTPLEAGAGKSLTDHHPRMTGVASFPPVEKTMVFIREVVPGLRAIGTLYNTSEVNSVRAVAAARSFLSGGGVELHESSIASSADAALAAAALIGRGIGALWITGDNTAIQAISGLIGICLENKIPLILNDGAYVGEGALASVGVGWRKTGRHTALYVARVLNGEDPGTIPIVNYTEEEILVNRETARKLKIAVPSYYSGE